MDLILWRHAEALPGDPDLERPLTPKGLKQAETIAKWLHAHLPDETRILVSPAKRTRQTVQPLKRKFEIVDEIAPGASPADVLAAAGWPKARKAVLVVGHQPTLGGVAALLLSGEEADWSIRKGAVWWLSQRNRDAESGIVLRAAISPEFCP